MDAQAYSMEGAIAGWLAFMPARNFSGVECTSLGLRNVSVEPHQQVTRRVAPEDLRNFLMSSFSSSAHSYLFLPFLTFGPSINFTNFGSNAAFMGLILERKPLTFARSCRLSTPALAADWY